MKWSYLPNTEQDRKEMLATIGVSTAEELFTHIPEKLRYNQELRLPPAMAETELVKHMRELAAQNADVNQYACFLGAGAYDHYIPSVVDHIVRRSEFYTAYTQYQPELSQGYLQVLWEYQSMICELTQMEVANASLYDGGSAVAEAAMLACGVKSRNKVLVARNVHPHYRQILTTYGRDWGFETVEISCQDGSVNLDNLAELLTADIAAVIVQNPNFWGGIEDIRPIEKLTHAAGALLIMSVDPISLGLLATPGQYQADIVVGEGQSLGLPLSFGGPYLGFFATTQKLMRKMPGRVVGQTTDINGKRGFVLTLQAREQHIRREKATSNICSNEALCALAATVYLSAVGKEGFNHIAKLCAQKAHYAYNKLMAVPGISRVFATPFFKEFVIKLDRPMAKVNEELLAANIIGGLDLGRYYPELDQCMLLCVTEKRSGQEIDRLAERLGAM